MSLASFPDGWCGIGHQWASYKNLEINCSKLHDLHSPHPLSTHSIIEWGHILIRTHRMEAGETDCRTSESGAKLFQLAVMLQADLSNNWRPTIHALVHDEGDAISQLKISQNTSPADNYRVIANGYFNQKRISEKIPFSNCLNEYLSQLIYLT